MAADKVQGQEQGFDMAALAALIRDTVESTVAPLREEVGRMRQAQPRFVKAPAPTNQRRSRRSYEAPEELRQRAMRGLAKGQNAAGQTRWLDTPEGRKNLPTEYWPLYGPGDLVRLNPDATAWGDGRTWGEIMALSRDNQEGVGEIIGTMNITDTWEPNYKVQIRGFTNGAGGFRESELLPYDYD
jgi:hypothetical protein